MPPADDWQNLFREYSSCEALAYNDFKDGGTLVYSKLVHLVNLRESLPEKDVHPAQ